MVLTLAQAIRNAIEVERGSGRFYRDLAARTSDPVTKALLIELAQIGDRHAGSIEQTSRSLSPAALPDGADPGVAMVETTPGWHLRSDVTFLQALEIALQAERQAEGYYRAVAAAFRDSKARDFFLRLAEEEAQHVVQVKTMIRKASRQAG